RDEAMAINAAKLAAQVLGIGTGGGLEKLTIHHEAWRAGRCTGPVEALCNPNELSFSRSVEWEQQKLADKGFASAYVQQEFLASNPETLTVNLFFDTYESRSD